MRTYYRGKSFADPALVVYVMKNRAGVCRVGITVSKKIGNAVERNRSRRIIRAAFAVVSKEYDIGNKDIVLVARSKTKRLKSTHIESVMRNLFDKAGLNKK